jgi:hypothetical protein
MTQLTKIEIQAQLKKLGINSSSELSFYLKEYKEYSHNQYPPVYTPQEVKNAAELDQQTHYPIARKFAQTCRSLFPVLGNFFTLSRVRAYKK